MSVKNIYLYENLCVCTSNVWNTRFIKKHSCVLFLCANTEIIVN